MLIVKITESFYRKLYKNENLAEVEDIQYIRNQGSEDIPEISLEEIKAAIGEMKNNRSPGDDGVVIEAIKEGGLAVLKTLKSLFNECLIQQRTPTRWDNAITTLIHKKGDATNLTNYRPISLLQPMYKFKRTK